MQNKHLYSVVLWVNHDKVRSMWVSVLGMAKDHPTLRGHEWVLGQVTDPDGINRKYLPKKLRDALRLLHMRGASIPGIGFVDAEFSTRETVVYRVRPIHLTHNELTTTIRHPAWRPTPAEQLIYPVVQLINDLETIRDSV